MRKAHRRLPAIAREFDLVPGRRTFGLAAEAAQAAWNIGLKSDARLFPIVAHVNTGFDLFADHLRGCRLHLTGQLGGIDRLAGFLADQQVGQSFGTRQTADMTDQDAVGAHQHGRFLLRWTADIMQHPVSREQMGRRCGMLGLLR